MTECWSEGELRAYLDRELPPGDMDRLAAHLKTCPACEARYGEVAGRAARVAEMVEALSAETAGKPQPRRARTRRRWAPVAAAVAACLAIALVLWPRREVPRAPQASHKAVPPAPVLPKPVEVVPAIIVRPPRQPGKARPRPQVHYFLALDDEPIETGVIMRVALGSGDIQAEVIYGEDGRARAIRAVGK